MKPRLHRTRGFTLLEMLVVLGIISGILALALPNLRGLRASSEMDAAARQLISDLSLARSRAINNRTTVSVVFIPSDILTLKLNGFSPEEQKQIRQLQGGVYTQYALFSTRRVGDQPGRSTPRYLTEWKTLPDKVFIAEQKFVALTDVGLPQFDYANFPFPFDTNTVQVALPYVAFDSEGRPCQADGTPLPAPADIRIPLARGAILYGRDPTTRAVIGFTAQETPKDNSVTIPNHVVIDSLTGRARLDRADIVSIP
jgi:prepilin-type N-terminal cleavage/methylation domain-containing protein